MAIAVPLLAFASENKWRVYAIYNYSDIDPAEYNDEIEKVSVGDVYGAVSGYGIGIEINKFSNFWINGEISQNSQKVDSEQADLQGNKTVFGYNQLTLTYADLIIKYSLPLIKNARKTLVTSLEAGAGLATTKIGLETSNGITKANSNTTTYGIKITGSVAQKIHKLFLRGTYASRMSTKSGIFDASGSVISGELGINFN